MTAFSRIGVMVSHETTVILTQFNSFTKACSESATNGCCWSGFLKGDYFDGGIDSFGRDFGRSFGECQEFEVEDFDTLS